MKKEFVCAKNKGKHEMILRSCELCIVNPNEHMKTLKADLGSITLQK